MKKLINTVFILGFILVSMQTVRHAYVRAFYDWPSVLDKYDEAIDTEIQQSNSLDTLLSKFDEAYRKVETFEDTASEATLKSVRQYSDEPYESKRKFKRAIVDWENKEKTIHEVKIFWFVGLFLLLIGSLLFYFNLNRMGIAFIITGFIEMIWWSSPTFSTSGAYLEFVKLLNIKLLLSTVTLALLILLKLLSEKKYNN